MKNRVFLTGSSLVCSLGKNKKQILKEIKKIEKKGYEKYIKKAKKADSLYKISNFSDDIWEKFYSTLEHVIKKAIKEAKLTKEDREDLHIFIGSTSMKVSLDEAKLTRLGYGVIGEFAEKVAGSTNGFKIVSTACTSSVNALNLAAKMIQHKKIKKALVIGLEFFNKSTTEGFESFMLLAKDRIYRPFDKKSGGIVLGEGCSAVVLDTGKVKDDDFEYLGSFNVCDVYSETTTNVDGESIFTCMDGAILSSKLGIEDIDLIKAHGTGSENNTIAETNSLNLLFKKYQHKTPITILKPYIGHTLGACGTNEIILLLLCIKNGFIPPTLGFESGEDITFEIIKKPKKIDKKANILLNFIGFSGNNTSIILGNK